MDISGKGIGGLGGPTVIFVTVVQTIKFSYIFFLKVSFEYGIIQTKQNKNSQKQCTVRLVPKYNVRK